jgi:hypothetical protein
MPKKSVKVARPTAKKGAAPKARADKPAKKQSAKATATKATTTKATTTKATTTKARSAKPSVAKKPKKISLGRPTISGEEKLFMLFHDDYHARQIFEFLRAQTVAELEQFSPQDIIHRLSRPIRETVDRIRTKLAARNRCLAGDEQFASDHQEKET